MTGPVPEAEYEAALAVVAGGRPNVGWDDALAVVRQAIRYGVARVCKG